jgi:hypothetical protein
MEYYQFYKNEKERSVSLILDILGTLDHFRHSFISLSQFFISRGGSKDKYDKLRLYFKTVFLSVKG